MLMGSTEGEIMEELDMEEGSRNLYFVVNASLPAISGFGMPTSLSIDVLLKLLTISP